MTGASPVTTIDGLAWLATQWRGSIVVTGLAPVMLQVLRYKLTMRACISPIKIPSNVCIMMACMGLIYYTQFC